ncbi:hypothetical protein [Novosphingobium beihaiensis]|uniref:Uncharacterized protein n=1 Tax=Novosphingobium beihaiensis TaxID=2930389 RepID=A0ABT0BQK2_9SPHN|nr:hypothetical protein [Novosphingobium beihaiensis]MCJ2187340.1 hypothetical protein [Novosphingobium beihaiensis]
MSEISALIYVMQSAKAAHDVVSSIVGLRISGEVAGKIAEVNKHLVEMTERLLAAQHENAALIARIRELEEEAVRTKAKHGELENYEMKDVGHGAIVYAVKPGHKIGEPAHWLCPNCFANNHKSILQRDQHFSVGCEAYVCPRCKADVMASKGCHPGSN